MRQFLLAPRRLCFHPCALLVGLSAAHETTEQYLEGGWVSARNKLHLSVVQICLFDKRHIWTYLLIFSRNLARILMKRFRWLVSMSEYK